MKEKTVFAITEKGHVLTDCGVKELLKYYPAAESIMSGYVLTRDKETVVDSFDPDKSSIEVIGLVLLEKQDDGKSRLTMLDQKESKKFIRHLKKHMDRQTTVWKELRQYVRLNAS